MQRALGRCLDSEYPDLDNMSRNILTNAIPASYFRRTQADASRMEAISPA